MKFHVNEIALNIQLVILVAAFLVIFPVPLKLRRFLLPAISLIAVVRLELVRFRRGYVSDIEILEGFNGVFVRSVVTVSR